MKRMLLLLCILSALMLGGCAENAAIGVIGGADGPTVLIVSGPDDLLPGD